MPVVDHIDGYDVPESEGVNELITLDCLATGLATLAEQVRILEAPMQTYEQQNRKRVTFYGFGLDLPPGAEQLLPCYFHWFGTSVCNYARLVGFLGGITSGVFTRASSADPKNHELIRNHCNAYVESIVELAPIKMWRNKVFAHFALTAPQSNDNAALLDASVMSPISYFDGRFRVGGMVSASSGAGVEMPHWSVTEAFAQLAPRFWPNAEQ